MTIRRHAEEMRLTRLIRSFPVTALIGARQVGKTTLALALARRIGGEVTRFDLEDAGDLELLRDPMLALAPLRGLVIIDEVQRRPELFPVLRVLADRPRRPARFLVLGSASPDLLRQSSETLAGRIAYHELTGLALDEVGVKWLDRLWLRGGFPRSFVARSEAQSVEWRRQFVRTFVERDVPQLGSRLAAAALHRFWTMLAHYHAQTWNASELGRAFGVADTTVRGYLDLLASTFVVCVLPPWHENLAKRQVRAPKVYIADTGILHTLLEIGSVAALVRHPKVGASWEGFMLAQVIRRLGARREECFFWATHSGAELDLLVVRGRRRLGFEIKRTAQPAPTRSMHVAMSDLGLDRLVVVHAGDRTGLLAPRIDAVAAGDLLDAIAPMK